MKVKEIISNTAKILNLKNIIEYLEDETKYDDNVIEDLSNLILAVNMTNNNISANYIELINSIKINNTKDNLSFDEITSNEILEIKKVTDLNGNNISYKLSTNGINVDKGIINIEYSYFPTIVGIDDSINYYTKINSLIFAMGVAGEYLFLKGAVDDAYMWDKRFKSTIFSVVRPRRSVKIPARRWS